MRLHLHMRKTSWLLDWRLQHNWGHWQMCRGETTINWPTSRCLSNTTHQPQVSVRKALCEDKPLLYSLSSCLVLLWSSLHVVVMLSISLKVPDIKSNHTRYESKASKSNGGCWNFWPCDRLPTSPGWRHASPSASLILMRASALENGWMNLLMRSACWWNDLRCMHLIYPPLSCLPMKWAKIWWNSPAGVPNKFLSRNTYM